MQLSNTEWEKKFKFASEHHDWQSLAELCFGDMDLYHKLKTDLYDADNARRRDLCGPGYFRSLPKKKSKKVKHTRKYSEADYEGRSKYSEQDYTGDNMSGYLDEDSFLSVINGLDAPTKLQEGDIVKFIAKRHLYTGQTGVVIETRGKMVLVEITSKEAPSHVNRSTGKAVRGKAIVRVPLTYVEKTHAK